MAKITLEAARVNAGLTQAEMADKLGISRELVIGFETGKREMRSAYLIAWAHITGFETDDLLLPLKYAKKRTVGRDND